MLKTTQKNKIEIPLHIFKYSQNPKHQDQMLAKIQTAKVIPVHSSGNEK